jgi:hypothetical protein
MEDPTKDKMPSLEYYPVLKEYDSLFWEFPKFPSNRDNDFSIDLMPRASPVSKTPYRIDTLGLKKW